MALETVNGLVREMPVKADDLRAVFIAGNATMIHLLLGLPPRYIRELPYVRPSTQLPR